MREIRIHGRGGQGAVVASKFLAVALFREESWVQSFPAFGVERRGAPVTAFLRVADSPINLRCEIYEPDDFMCWFNIGGMLPHGEVESSMRLFAKEVMPHFQ